MAIIKAGAEPLAALGAFLKPFGELVVRSESRQALERYATGLLADLPRKTASGMGRALPGISGQRLQSFLTRAAWDSGEMDRLRIGQMVQGASVGNGVLVVDDTGFAKKGRHSVGVARQYSGTLGRVDNCQIVVSTHYVDSLYDWPVLARLYLPERWAKDRARCRRAQVPKAARFQTKGQIALQLIEEGRAAGVIPRAVLIDAGYGNQIPWMAWRPGNWPTARESALPCGSASRRPWRATPAIRPPRPMPERAAPARHRPWNGACPA